MSDDSYFPQWFYAFSIVPSATPTQRPSNITKNPFAEAAPRLPKRVHETAEGENFIFGNVPQPTKRPRPGLSSYYCIVSASLLLLLLPTEVPSGDTSKPPIGYKCKRCESTEVSLLRYGAGDSSCDSQHFIDSCPERTKPPEGYLCRICSIPGHLVRDCPTKHAVGDTGGHKPRQGYVCRACGSELHYIADCPVASQRGPHGQGGKRRPPKEIGRMFCVPLDPCLFIYDAHPAEECWFCLSNPNLA